MEDFLVEIDIAREYDTAEHFEIATVPTTLVLDQRGNVIGGVEGPLTKQSISAIIDLLKKLEKQ